MPPPPRSDNSWWLMSSWTFSFTFFPLKGLWVPSRFLNSSGHSLTARKYPSHGSPLPFPHPLGFKTKANLPTSPVVWPRAGLLAALFYPHSVCAFMQTVRAFEDAQKDVCDIASSILAHVLVQTYSVPCPRLKHCNWAQLCVWQMKTVIPSWGFIHSSTRTCRNSALFITQETFINHHPACVYQMM